MKSEFQIKKVTYPSIEAITRGLKRSLTMSGYDEQAKQIPRHNSWAPDSHLYSDSSGVKYTKNNVEDCDEIFMPVGTKCYCNDKGKDYWLIKRPRWLGPPSRWDWRRWYGDYGPCYAITDPEAGQSGPAADQARFIDEQVIVTHDKAPVGVCIY